MLWNFYFKLKRTFLIYLILFSLPSGAGNGLCYLWSASLPYPLLYTHIYNTNTHGCGVLWSVLLSSQRSPRGCEGPKIKIIVEKEAINVILWVEQRWCRQITNTSNAVVNVTLSPTTQSSPSSVLSLPPSIVHLLQALAGRPCSWILPDKPLNKPQSLTSGAGSCHVM